MKLENQIQNLNIQDEPIKEILGKSPTFLIRWGATIIFIFFICLFLLTIIIKYPEKITTQAVIVLNSTPKGIINNAIGKLKKLNIHEGDFVRQGHVLGYMESIADYNQVMELKQYVNEIEQSKVQKSAVYFNQLGELQLFYKNFYDAFLLFNHFSKNGINEQKRKLLIREIDNLKFQLVHLGNQKKLINNRISLMDKNLKIKQGLREHNLVSEVEFNEDASRMQNEEISIPQIEITVETQNRFIIEKQSQLLDMEQNFIDYKNIFNQQLKILKTEIQNWIAKFCLVAPIDGYVYFPNTVQENQYISSQKEVFFIANKDSNFYAEVYVPQNNFGKIKLKQKVILKCDAFPFQEYGVIYGHVNLVSEVPTDKGYLTYIALDKFQNLKNKRIIYKHGLTAAADIILKDKTLLERFYYSFVKTTTL